MNTQIEELNKACGMAEKAGMRLLKSHIKQYTRADGTVVQEHDDSRQASQHADKVSANANSHEGHRNAEQAHAYAMHEHIQAAKAAADRGDSKAVQHHAGEITRHHIASVEHAHAQSPRDGEERNEFNKKYTSGFMASLRSHTAQ